MATSVSTTPFQIPVRRDIAFNFGANVAQSPAANPRVTHLWYAFSVLGPGAETFFVRVMKRARAEVRDAELRAQVDAFLLQEGLHTRHHRTLNSQLAEWGYDIDRASAVAERTLRDLDGAGLRDLLALLIAGEYAIYTLARLILEDPALLAPMSPEVRRLLEWHALEEVEHQSVACDVYRHLFGEGIRHRFVHVRALIKACRILVTAVGQIRAVLMQAEPAPPPAQQLAHFYYLFGMPGLLRRVAVRLPRFLAPRFRHWADPRDLELIARAADRVYDPV